METGTDLKHLVLFEKGQPTSDLSYSLYNQDNVAVASGTATITSGQLSHLIEIDGSFNVLTKPLFEQMKLQWTYTTDSQSVTEDHRYRLHADIGFSLSYDSIRNMLGVTEEELPTREIDLFGAYLHFLNQFNTDVDLSTYKDAGTFDTYRIATAIEASAALKIFPTLQVRLPKTYDSGTSSYERWTSIDWAALESELSTKLLDGLNVIDPDLELFEQITIFGISDADTDVITAT